MKIEKIIFISRFIFDALLVKCMIRNTNSYCRSPANTLRNDPLTCNRKNPRKTTTIYIYRIKCPAYISNNVTTTQVQSVSKIVLSILISEASTNELYKSSEKGSVDLQYLIIFLE